MPYLKEAEEFKKKLRDKILGNDNPTGEVLLPTYQNFFQDVSEFLQEVRKLIGPNVIIALVSEDDELTMSFHFHKIPQLADLDLFQAVFEVADLKEPDKNTLTVIVDSVRAYIENHLDTKIPDASGG